VNININITTCGPVEQKLDQIIKGQEKIMAEIDDLNQKLDEQSAAISAFTDTLNTGVTAIQTEIQQLAAAVQSATDLATLKAQVTQAAGRVSTATDGISAASQTLQTQIDALNADDPATPGASRSKKR
jgi:outer membrane murein-binding lipoprotein Lpp